MLLEPSKAGRDIMPVDTITLDMTVDDVNFSISNTKPTSQMKIVDIMFPVKNLFLKLIKNAQ